MSTKKKRKPVKGFNLASVKFNEEAWLHLRHPAYDHLLYVGEDADDQGRLVGQSLDAKPVRVLVLNSKHAKVRKTRADLEQAALDNGKAITSAVEDEILKGTILSAMAKFENVYHGDKELDAENDDDKVLFCQITESYFEQVAVFSAKRENFFVEGSSG